MALKYDIHLSAYKISPETILKIEEIGFKRDEFANNTRCEVTAYHGTYRGNEDLPNDHLWNKICKILDADNLFSGGLEKEEFESDSIFYFDNSGFEIKPLLPEMETEQPASNIYKACDIHINIDVENSNYKCLKYLEALRIASFEKVKDGNIHRIYTITTESLEDGKKAFGVLSDYFGDLKGLSGKMKLEKTIKYFRKPANATALPLTNKIFFQKWLDRIETIYVK